MRMKNYFSHITLNIFGSCTTNFICFQEKFLKVLHRETKCTVILSRLLLPEINVKVTSFQSHLFLTRPVFNNLLSKLLATLFSFSQKMLSFSALSHVKCVDLNAKAGLPHFSSSLRMWRGREALELSYKWKTNNRFSVYFPLCSFAGCLAPGCVGVWRSSNQRS